MKRNYKNNRKTKLFSSLVPILLLLLIGGFAGSRIIQNHNTNINEISSSEENSLVSNVLESNKNEVMQNNTIIKNGVSNQENVVTNDGKIENSAKEEESKTEISNTKKQFDSSVAFIGDSRTQGFIMYNGLSKIQDYSYVGLMVDTAVTKKFIKNSNGEKITLLQDMKNKNIKTVYIMLGLNELGWSYPSVFKLKYEELIDEIRKVKPNCKIYVQSIIPVTRSKDKEDKYFNNTNVAKFNKLIQEVANEKDVTYLDVKSALIDSEGYLPNEASTDGIHINKAYCQKWLEYLKNNS